MKIKFINNIIAFINSKKEGYFQHTRDDLFRLIKGNPDSILDVGCGYGLTAKRIKERFNSKLAFGIEINREAAIKAEENLDGVLVIDLNKTCELPLKEKFDLIILADILEHLANPIDLLVSLKNLLNENGQIIISIPNIRNWRIIFELIFKGDWRYRNKGILDSTHLRFFTKKSAERMIKSAGYYEEAYNYRLRLFDKLINILTFTIIKDFLITQHFFSVFKR